MGDLESLQCLGVGQVGSDAHIHILALLENYIKEKERKRGYLHVMTPCVGTVNLYKTSGHCDHYRENMFPAMEMEGESYVLRPMNCPHSFK